MTGGGHWIVCNNWIYISSQMDLFIVCFFSSNLTRLLIFKPNSKPRNLIIVILQSSDIPKLVLEQSLSSLFNHLYFDMSNQTKSMDPRFNTKFAKLWDAHYSNDGEQIPFNHIIEHFLDLFDCHELVAIILFSRLKHPR